MIVLPPFPQNRKADTKRQAELRVYNDISQSPVPGLAVYGGKTAPEAPEIDMTLWLQKEGRVGMEIKGGTYVRERGQWMLRTIDGPGVVDSPVIQARDAAMSFRDAVKQLGRKVFVFAFLVFPDMTENRDIADEAARQKVHVLFGAGQLVERMLQVVSTQEVFQPPTATQIQEEARLFIPGIEYRTPVSAAPDAGPGAVSPPELDLIARQVIIQNAKVVNVYTTG